MVVTNWLRFLSRRTSASRGQRVTYRKRRSPAGLARSVEGLEDRTLLSALNGPLAEYVRFAMSDPVPATPKPSADSAVSSPTAAADTVNVGTPPIIDVLTATASDWLLLNGDITTPNETDAFIVTLTQAVGLFIDIDAADAGLSFIDSVVSIFDSSNSFVDSNDDGFDFLGFDTPINSISFAFPTFRDSALYVDLQPGTYTILVDALGSTTGAYELRLLADANYDSQVPVLDSLSGAADTLYLDFDGHSASDSWGTYNATPYDLDGDPTTFSPGERLAMRNMWEVVSEDYSPFNVNISTVEPPVIANGIAHRMVVTDSSPSIVGLPPQGILGVAFLGSYAGFGTSDNVAFTFASNFSSTGGGASGFIMAAGVEMGNTTSHEFGHTLSLEHYATIAGSAGPAAVIPNGIMATPDRGLNREIWATGIAENGVSQDDITLISSAANTFGFRTDDHGNTTATATLVNPVGVIFDTKGVIEHPTNDTDMFRFDVGGLTTFTVDVNGYSGDGDIEIRLLDSGGTQVATHDPLTSFDAFITQTLASGTYYLEVKSDGQTGELGQYTVHVETTFTPTLTLTIDPNAISEAGGVATATVTRNNGTTGDLTVNLVSSDTTAATVPASVIIPDGQTAVTFAVSAVDDLFPDGTQIAIITASATGLIDGVDDVAVIDNETAALTLSIAPSSMLENGGFAVATLTRNSGTNFELLVNLFSSDTTEAAVPATVTFLEGEDTITFLVTGVDDLLVDGTQTVTVTATAAGHANGADTVDVIDDDAFTFTITPFAIAENGGVATATLRRNGSIAAALQVFLVSSDTTEATVPAFVNFAAGQRTVTFQIHAVDDFLADGDQVVNITASAAGVGQETAQVIVVDNDVPTLTLTITPASISEAGGLAIGTVTRNTLPIGNMFVALSSSDTTEATVPSFVVIPAGEFSVSFLITAVDDAIEDPIQVVTITASTPGLISGSANLNVIDNDSIRIVGTNGDDVFSFIAREPGQSHVVQVNGVTTVLDPNIRIVRFIGRGGYDQLTALGTSGNDKAVFSPTSVTFTGPGFDIYSLSVERNLVFALGGTSQTATFFDSAGADRFFADPDAAYMTGAGYSNQSVGFSMNVGAMNFGGIDTSVLRDAASNDHLIAVPDKSVLGSQGFRSIALRSERTVVRGIRGGESDNADLFDNDNDQTYNAAPGFARLTGGGLFYQVTGFDHVNMMASGGFDSANINGGAEDEQFVGRSTVASLIGAKSVLSVFNFERVTVAGGGGFDSAFLYDSTANDVFTGFGQVATMQGLRYLNRAIGFDQVSIFGYYGVNRKVTGSFDFLFREFGTWV